MNFRDVSLGRDEVDRGVEGGLEPHWFLPVLLTISIPRLELLAVLFDELLQRLGATPREQDTNEMLENLWLQVLGLDDVPAAIGHRASEAAVVGRDETSEHLQPTHRQPQ